MTREQRLVSLHPPTRQVGKTSQAAGHRERVSERSADFEAKVRALVEARIRRPTSPITNRLPVMGRTQLLAVADQRALTAVDLPGRRVTLDELHELGWMVCALNDLHEAWRRAKRQARLARVRDPGGASAESRRLDGRVAELKDRLDRAWTLVDAAYERVRRAGRRVAQGDPSRERDYRSYHAARAWRFQARRRANAMKEMGGVWDDESDE